MKECVEGLKWLQFIMNSNQTMPEIRDWSEVYKFAFKHSLLGICNPLDFDVKLPKTLLYQWIGDLQAIKAQNQLLNHRVVEVYSFMREEEFSCCVLKGQGNALMYPNPMLRCPGDIDIWVNVDKETLYSFVKKRFPDAKESVKHIKFPLFSDIEVDMHYTPLQLLHSRHNILLQQWFKEQGGEQFVHYVRLPETGIDVAVPTAKFNVVYQLGHIMIHLLDEGVGFRQLIDFYYVLKGVGGISQEEQDEIVQKWKRLGLFRLASAIIWIESEILGLPEHYLLIAPNQRLGRILLKDVLEGGNFGRYSVRQTYRLNRRRLKRKISTFSRVIRLLPCFPCEATSWIVRRLITLMMLKK